MGGHLRGPIQTIGMVGGLGFVLGALTALGALLGLYLDRRWGTGPLFTLAGTLLGMGAGFFEVISVMRRVGQDN